MPTRTGLVGWKARSVDRRPRRERADELAVANRVELHGAIRAADREPLAVLREGRGGGVPAGGEVALLLAVAGEVAHTRLAGADGHDPLAVGRCHEAVRLPAESDRTLNGDRRDDHALVRARGDDRGRTGMREHAADRAGVRKGLHDRAVLGVDERGEIIGPAEQEARLVPIDARGSSTSAGCVNLADSLPSAGFQRMDVLPAAPARSCPSRLIARLITGAASGPISCAPPWRDWPGPRSE